MPDGHDQRPYHGAGRTTIIMPMTVSAPAEPAALYRARRGRVDVVDVPEYPFVSVDGHGAPGGAEFVSALAALYPIAYGICFTLRASGIDEKVSPLEALWWTADPAADYAAALARGGYGEADKAGWSWRTMIRLPDAADAGMVARVRAEAALRHPESGAGLERVRFRRWREGLCAQTLHVGPYSAELATVELLHRFVVDAGYRATGRHHEIYLGDPRRCAPERLRTILRQRIVRSRPAAARS